MKKANSRIQHLFLLHLIMIIIGFAGVLRKDIHMDSIPLTWYRMLLGCLGVLVYLTITRKFKLVTTKQLLRYAGVGILIAAHWVFFFEAIQVSNVSVTLACISSTALFNSILEPLLLKRKFILYEILIGLVVIVGLLFIFSFETQFTLGIIYSLICTVLGALFIIFNSHFVKSERSEIITVYEMFFGVIAILLYWILSGSLSFETFQVPSSDIISLLILGFIGTSFAFVAGVFVMKKISTFTFSLAQNLEPVYGIFLAYIFFQDSEHMTIGFYIGTVIIISSLFLNGILRNKKHADIGENGEKSLS